MVNVYSSYSTFTEEELAELQVGSKVSAEIVIEPLKVKTFLSDLSILTIPFYYTENPLTV